MKTLETGKRHKMKVVNNSDEVFERDKKIKHDAKQMNQSPYDDQTENDVGSSHGVQVQFCSEDISWPGWPRGTYTHL